MEDSSSSSSFEPPDGEGEPDGEGVGAGVDLSVLAGVVEVVVEEEVVVVVVVGISEVEVVEGEVLEDVELTTRPELVGARNDVVGRGVLEESLGGGGLEPPFLSPPMICPSTAMIDLADPDLSE